MLDDMYQIIFTISIAPNTPVPVARKIESSTSTPPKSSTSPLVSRPFPSLTPSGLIAYRTPRQSRSFQQLKTWALSYTSGSVLRQWESQGSSLWSSWTVVGLSRGDQWTSGYPISIFPYFSLEYPMESAFIGPGLRSHTLKLHKQRYHTYCIQHAFALSPFGINYPQLQYILGEISVRTWPT